MRRLPYYPEASLLMSYIQGEGRDQGTLFSVVLDDFVPADHVCRVIDAFVEKLMMSELGFERAQAAETGRPGYDPRDLLKGSAKGETLRIRVTADELRTIEAAAKASGKTRLEFIRSKLLVPTGA